MYRKKINLLPAQHVRFLQLRTIKEQEFSPWEIRGHSISWTVQQGEIKNILWKLFNVIFYWNPFWHLLLQNWHRSEFHRIISSSLTLNYRKLSLGWDPQCKVPLWKKYYIAQSLHSITIVNSNGLYTTLENCYYFSIGLPIWGKLAWHPCLERN